jgi:hypothetical protein
MKMPKKEGELSSKEQAVADLQAAGININNDRKTVEEQMEIFRNPKPLAEETGSDPNALRAEILEDLIAIIEGDLEDITNARRDSPGIQINERNPEYKKAMDELVSGLESGLKDLKKSRLEFIDAYRKA